MGTPESTPPSKWTFINEAVGRVVAPVMISLIFGICLAAVPFGIWSLLGYLRGWNLDEASIPIGIKIFAGVCCSMALMPGVGVAITTIADCRGEWRHAHGRCRKCGYDLRATPDRCPECGREVVGKET